MKIDMTETKESTQPSTNVHLSFLIMKHNTSQCVGLLRLTFALISFIDDSCNDDNLTMSEISGSSFLFLTI